MIKDLPKEDLPRERLISYGAGSLSNEELLSIIIRTGTRGTSVKDLSKEILSSCKDINDLKSLSLGTLKNIKGLGSVKAVSLLAAIELGRRVYSVGPQKEKLKILCAGDAYTQFAGLISDKKQENLLAIYLDPNRRVLAHKILFVGTLNSSLVHPREVFKEALLENATEIIIMHNHPSGYCVPSKADNEFTRELCEVGVAMKITILDHLIVSECDYYSYQESGCLIYA